MDQKELKILLDEFSKTLPKFSDGRIDYTTSKRCPVITCFVMYDGKILLLKRSDKVSTYKGIWNSVSGYIDDYNPLEEKAYIEIEEELGITKEMISEIRLGDSYEVNDTKTWIVFPLLAILNKKPEIKIDWEHTEYKWINPEELLHYDIVKDLDKSLERVL
jgi:8-oxo-dGTP pyrophosphatase MutT (NUDIX family)